MFASSCGSSPQRADAPLIVARAPHAALSHELTVAALGRFATRIAYQALTVAAAMTVALILASPIDVAISLVAVLAAVRSAQLEAAPP